MASPDSDDGRSRNGGIDVRGPRLHHGPMPIDQDPWPKDRERAVTVLASIVREIRDSDDDYRETVLYEFMQTAWPTQWSQSQ